MIWRGCSGEPSRGRAHLARLALQQPEEDTRVRDEKTLERFARKDEASQLLLGNDVGDWRFAEEAGDLAEEVAGPQRSAILAVHPNRRRAVKDHVQAGALQALPADALALAEHLLSQGLHQAH